MIFQILGLVRHDELLPGHLKKFKINYGKILLISFNATMSYIIVSMIRSVGYKNHQVFKTKIISSCRMIIVLYKEKYLFVYNNKITVLAIVFILKTRFAN